ncbi:hypothetical protein L207DRAFT_603767 [Hyaloscypha variabilis F]|uniref:RING-type domain-containing protein n=1 Tax=Hyaloscypha variabilis (strain UAMH 11265 / GT02V1 / F) TaxID=1149755 RepID=A0A2J6R836_HYAVF|nr:hypothetical protein L207DRAFT_603767 [Hyaloscypha variabilis F]
MSCQICQGFFTEKKCPCYFPESYQCDHTLTETEEEKYIQEKKLLDTEYEFCRSQLVPLWNPESEAHWIENVIKVRDWKRNTSNPNKLDLYFYYKAAKEGQTRLFGSDALFKKQEYSTAQAVKFLDELSEKATEVETRWRKHTKTFKIHALGCDFDIKLEQIPKSAAREPVCNICREDFWDIEDVCKSKLEPIGVEDASPTFPESMEFPSKLFHSSYRPGEPRCVQAVKLPCGHTFGFSCLENWLQIETNGFHQVSCPYCGAGIARCVHAVGTRDEQIIPVDATSNGQAVETFDSEIDGNAEEELETESLPITSVPGLRSVEEEEEEESATASEWFRSRESSAPLDALEREPVNVRPSSAGSPGHAMELNDFVVDTTEIETLISAPTSQSQLGNTLRSPPNMGNYGEYRDVQEGDESDLD